MGTGRFIAPGSPAMDYHPIQQRKGGGLEVDILLVTSCYRNWDKFQLDGPLGWYEFFFHFWFLLCTMTITSLMIDKFTCITWS